MANIREINLTTPAMQAARALCHGADNNSEYVRGVAELLIDTQGFGSVDDVRDDLMNWLVTGKMPSRPASEILADYDRGCRGEADIDMRAILWEVIEDVRESYGLAIKHERAISMYPDDLDFDSIEASVSDYLTNNYGDC